MTLEEGKRKVLELLDEYGTGEQVDEELETRLPDLFDMAQKRLAQIKKIVRCAEMVRTEGTWECELPGDFRVPYRVWRNGRLCTWRYRFRNGRLLLPEGETGRIELEYFAAPQTVDGDTPEDYEFEIGEEAADCMPFFVAAAALAADMVQDGRVLMSIYEAMVNDLDTSLPPAMGQVANTLYRGVER